MSNILNLAKVSNIFLFNRLLIVFWNPKVQKDLQKLKKCLTLFRKIIEKNRYTFEIDSNINILIVMKKEII